MLFESLSGSQKWVVTLVFTACFILIVSPLTLAGLTRVGDVIGIRMINTRGCLSWVGVAVQVLLFFLLIRLVVHVLTKKSSSKKEGYNLDGTACAGNTSEYGTVTGKKYPPFLGLVSPGDMMSCNAAQLEAQDANSAECYDAARACLSDPFGQECVDKLENCANVCPDKDLVKLVQSHCGFVYRQ